MNQICHFLSPHNFSFSLISWCFPSKSKKSFYGKESFWDFSNVPTARNLREENLVRKTVEMYLSNKTKIRL